MLENQSDKYVDPLQTLERRLTSIDKYLTNDYIAEHLFSKRKQLLRHQRYGPDVSGGKSDAAEKKRDFKRLLQS